MNGGAYCGAPLQEYDVDLGFLAGDDHVGEVHAEVRREGESIKRGRVNFSASPREHAGLGGWNGRNGGGWRGQEILHAAHFGVEHIADGLEFFEAFDCEFGRGIAAGGLDEDNSKAEPACDDVGGEVGVPNARVVDDDLAAVKNASVHRHALVGELTAPRVETRLRGQNQDR